MMHQSNDQRICSCFLSNSLAYILHQFDDLIIYHRDAGERVRVFESNFAAQEFEEIVCYLYVGEGMEVWL